MESNPYINLNIYGININHPKDWQIIINPNHKFTFNEGLVKVEKVTSVEEEETSLAIRWGKMKEDIDINDYVEELENQYKEKEEKSRNQDRYKMFRKEKILLNDTTEAYFIKSKIIANHSIYRIMGKEELIEVLQMVTYSKKTKRIIIASVSTTSEALKLNEDEIMKMLRTLQENLNSTVTEYV